MLAPGIEDGSMAQPEIVNVCMLILSLEQLRAVVGAVPDKVAAL
jgi:hypothetical protein